MSPQKILVVDDNDIVRCVVSKMLSRLGHIVASADSGAKAMGVFLRNRFDIVLSDYDMPGMDGVAFAYSIKMHRPDMPVVIMTGSDTSHAVFLASEVVDEVIAKPFTMEELDVTVQNHSDKALASRPRTLKGEEMAHGQRRATSQAAVRSPAAGVPAVAGL